MSIRNKLTFCIDSIRTQYNRIKKKKLLVEFIEAVIMYVCEPKSYDPYNFQELLTSVR